MDFLRQDLKGIGQALASREQKLLFAGAFAAIWALYAVFTDIVVLQELDFNPNLKLLDAAAITLIALLTSLLVTAMVYTAKNGLGVKVKSKNGILGSVVALFCTACPVCQPIWLVWLGLAVIVAAIAAITGLQPKGTRPVAHTHLMGVARLTLLVLVVLLAYVAFRARSGG